MSDLFPDYKKKKPDRILKFEDKNRTTDIVTNFYFPLYT